MKKLFCITLLFYSLLGLGQQKKPLTTYTTSKVGITSLQFSASSTEDLKTINWKDIKEIFSHNSDQEQLIELAFKIDFPKSKNQIKGSFKVGGKQKNIDSLIIRSKKLVKSLARIIHKNK